MAASVEEVAGTSFPDQNQRLSPELGVQQRHQVLIQWNNTASDFPKDRCIHELFAEQASLTPTAEAVTLGDLRLTYAELDNQANQLAHYLRTIGVGPEVVVGLCVERSLELIVGLMGILKAGGAYLPLDRNYPQERIAYQVKDARAPFILTSATTDAVLSPYGLRTIKLDLQTPEIAKQPTNAPESGVSSENLAYVMYTSGSSGNPKGVGVVHRNISRLVLNTNYVQISPKDVFLQLAPVTFDAATFEIWGALLNGAKLALYPPDPMLDLLKLKSVIHKAGVSILWLTAGLFNSIVDGDSLILAPVKQLLVGGDVVSATHVKRLTEQIPTCHVINGYGPTEGTTFSVCFPIPDVSAIEKNVPIGRPVSNSTAYVLNSDGQPVPIGETGELHIGGAGLARGYFHRPDMTAEAFVPNPFGGPGSRLYRTGDVARYSSDGVLEFVGRVDFQVKVRGYRIELEEVEAALLSNPDIRQAAVVVQSEPRGDKKLVAYVVAAGKAPDFKKVREHMGRRLPEYMVPSAMIVVDALPLTANGKVDRRALLAPQKSAERTAAGPGVEEAITEIWSATLGTNNVGPDDDFFDLGGTSLALINVVVEMSKRFDIPLETGIVAGGATVRALTQAVKEKISGRQQEQQIEQMITEIWSATLGTNNVGPDDDFFDLGGTSLALINVVVEMSKRFDIPLETGIVAGGATVRALTQAVKEKMTDATAQPGPQIEQTITDIWSATLGTNNIGLDDDFFDLGGTSLALINVVVEMSKRFDIPLETGIVAGGATVRALTQAVKEKMADATAQPESQIEQEISEIWAATLGTNNIGLDDDFFDLGGTSLALINVVVEMSKRFDIPLETGIVAGGATVRALTQAVKEKMAGATAQPGPQIEQTITEIWSATLGTNNIGPDDDFFDLGGTSLALINVVVEMSKRFDIPLETGIVAGGATVRALTQAVKEKMADATAQPEPQIEQAITEIWSATLGTNNIGPDDDFFDLGGTSLALINVVVEMSKRFDIPLETGIVAGGATVRALTQAVKEKMADATAQPEPQIEQEISEIWAATLGTNNIGLDDDFFDRGGTSLALINVVVEMGKRFGIPLETGIVAGGATVRALAQAVKEKMAGKQQEKQIEQAISEIWAATLGTNNIGLDDDFFDRGGTSLALINVVVEMGKRFGIPLETGIVAGGATVRALAQAVNERIDGAKQEPQIEQAITAIWASTLGTNNIGVDDDFFDLGGTSLALINVVMEMSKQFGVPLETSIVTGGATVRALAQAVSSS